MTPFCLYRLSLKQLAQECVRAHQQTGLISAHQRQVYGFTWFFGYAIDREKGDVLLLGLKDPQRPPLELDCLVTAIRSAYPGSAPGYTGAPGCSLDAHPNPRLQKSRVDGIPWNTRWATVMLEADYLMKRISQGRDNPGIPGLTSWFDLMLRLAKRSHGGQGDEQDRWWFTRPERGTDRTLLLDRDGDLVLLYRNPVILQTEKLVGGKYGTGLVAKEAQQFADAFTRNLDLLGRKYRSIGELLTLYRLLDVMVHVREVGKTEPPLKEYWFRGYRHPYAGPPLAYPTLARSTRWQDGRYTRSYRVWGGVHMPLDLDRTACRSETAGGALMRAIIDRP